MGNITVKKNSLSTLNDKITNKGPVFKEAVLLTVILSMVLIMSFASKYFFSLRNLEALLMGLTVEGPIVLAMVILLITGGLDLSIGSTLALSGVVTGLCLVNGVPLIVSICIGLGSCIIVGMINGILISYLRINPFITTLGMMIALRGLVQVIAKGRAVINLPSDFLLIGQGKLWGIQFPIYVLIFLVFVGDYTLRNMRFFRQFYYIGGNEKAAFLNGMNVNYIKIIAYSLVGLSAGISGIMLTSRIGSASVTVGQGIEMRVITAAIIGGASLMGGKGTILGAFLGALFMGILSNSLNLLGVDVYWQNLITGMTLISAITIDSLIEKRKQRGK